MQDGVDAMKIGLRVLMALNEKRAPDPADLDALRHFAPLLGDLAPDELACEVIQRAIGVPKCWRHVWDIQSELLQKRRSGP